jgi:hypothetical protein
VLAAAADRNHDVLAGCITRRPADWLHHDVLGWLTAITTIWLSWLQSRVLAAAAAITTYWLPGR